MRICLFRAVSDFNARWGRKVAIICAAIVFTIGAIVMGASPNKEVLLVGRIILGMGIGRFITVLCGLL